MSVANDRLSVSKLSGLKLLDRTSKTVPVTVYRDSIDNAHRHIVLELDAMIQSFTERPYRASMISEIKSNLFMPELFSDDSFMIYTGNGIIHEIRLSAFLANIDSPDYDKKRIRSFLKKGLPIGSCSFDSFPFRSLTLSYEYGVLSLSKPNGKNIITFSNHEKGQLAYSLIEGETFEGLISSFEVYCETGKVEPQYSLYLHDILDVEVKNMGSAGKMKMLARDLGI